MRSRISTISSLCLAVYGKVGVPKVGISICCLSRWVRLQTANSLRTHANMRKHDLKFVQGLHRILRRSFGKKLDMNPVVFLQSMFLVGNLIHLAMRMDI